MRRSGAFRLATVLGFSLLAGACTQQFDQQGAIQDLGDRLETRLAPDLASGRASMQRLPDGARVAIPDEQLFSTGGVALDSKGRDSLTAVIQALIEPTLLSVSVADSPTASPALQGPRTRAVKDYFVEHGLGGMFGDDSVPQAVAQPAPDGSLPQGATITISVVPPAAS